MAPSGHLLLRVSIREKKKKAAGILDIHIAYCAQNSTDAGRIEISIGLDTKCDDVVGMLHSAMPRVVCIYVRTVQFVCRKCINILQ